MTRLTNFIDHFTKYSERNIMDNMAYEVFEVYLVYMCKANIITSKEYRDTIEKLKEIKID